MPSVGGNSPGVVTGFTFTTKTAAYTAAAGEYVLANATSVAFTVTLPASPSMGTVVGVKKVDSSASLITVVGSNATTIDGDTSCTLNAFDAGGIFVFDGANWQVQSTVALNASSATAVSGSLTVSTKTASYTAVAGNYVMADASAGAFTVTLPASAVIGATVGVRKIDNTAYNVNVFGAVGIETSGNYFYVLGARDQSAEFVYDGTLWRSIRASESARVPAAPVLAPAMWYSNSLSGATSTFTYGLSNGQLYLMPYFFSRPTTIQGMGTWVTTGAASGSIRFGIYAMNPTTAAVGALLLDSGAYAGASNNGVACYISGLSATMPAGWAYLAMLAYQAPTCLAVAYGTPFLGQSSLTSAVGWTYGIATATAGGSLPTNPTVVFQAGSGVPSISFQTASI